VPNQAVVSSARVKAQAYGVGFDLAGVAALGPMETAPRLHEWLAAGYHGDMDYLARGAVLREDSTRPETGMRSAIVVGLDYGGRQPGGPVARYARGRDYHDVMRDMLRMLHAQIERELGATMAARPYVDTGPVLERDLARRAGLGWFGKNTLLINPSRGSFFFLGALFVAADLEPDAPFDADRCGTCTRCLDACPTGAFPEPRVLDATKCISYLTIEHRGSIPRELRPAIGDLVFGCDICQDVCPWNVRFAREPHVAALAPDPELATPDLGELLRLDDAAFRARFRSSAVSRTKRRGLARNAAVVLGNRRQASDVPVLAAALADDDAIVREHAAWALGRVQRTGEVTHALERALATEGDARVRAEIDAALAGAP
jgi:epoxyqueuosine reductase